jgi:hypothetical protein
MKNKQNFLFLAFLIELIFLFYRKNELGIYLSAIALSGAGLFLSIYPYFLVKKSKVPCEELFLEHNHPKPQSASKIKGFIWLAFGLFAGIFAIWLNYHMRKFPIDINQSDIIPFIEDVFLKRWENGIAVYSVFDGFGYGAFHPNYMPFHWLSFLVSFFFGFDHRWMLFFIYLMATAIYTHVLLRNFVSVKRILLLLFLPFLLVFSILESQGKDAVHTIEILIMGYYLLLGLSLFSKYALVQAVGMLLPLLSRYSFVFWLPVHFFSWLKTQPKRFLWVSISGLGLLALFLGPFLYQTPTMFVGFNANYMVAALREWGGQSWQQPGDDPFQLFHGMGVASWYYKLYPGSLEDKINALNLSLLMVSVLSMIGLMILTPRIKKVLSPNMFSLLSLKFMLTLFYAFVTIPYLYLNWVPLVLSVVILSRLAEPNNLHNKNV